MKNIFSPFIEKNKVVILDGALATELEKRGADLNDQLWSAKLLMENPSLIRQVHMDYLEAGADVITSASYQASMEGFAKRGLSAGQSIQLMQLSIDLCLQAREEVIRKKNLTEPLPLVAASIGPYGAYLANGAEYTGEYGIGIEALKNFHRSRMQVLYNSGADFFAFETIPSLDEGMALLQLLKEFPNKQAWLSCSCRDLLHTCHGERMAEVAKLAEQSDQIAAIGVNCTSPEFVASLIKEIKTVTSKPVLVYPNLGETYDAMNKCWLPGEHSHAFASYTDEWYQAGATLIGGCCRTSPNDIRELAMKFKKK